jgi:hypothetical protein
VAGNWKGRKGLRMYRWRLRIRIERSLGFFSQLQNGLVPVNIHRRLRCDVGVGAWRGEKNDAIFSQPESRNRVAKIAICCNDEKCGRGWVIEGMDDEVHCNGVV